jgi:hypothetical protein
MFIGHFGIGFAAKDAAPRMSLGMLFLASLWADLICPIFMLLGIESAHIGGDGYMPVVFQFPFSHSLLALLLWAGLFAWIYTKLAKDRHNAVVLGACVLSHFVLDWLTHRSGIQLFPGGALHGAGLWDEPPFVALLENVMLFGGLLIYLRATRSRDKIGSIALWSLFILLFASYFVTFFAPPPPSAMAMARFNLVSWLFPLWGWWIDRHRTFSRKTSY